MKHKNLICLAVVASLGVSSVSFAQPARHDREVRQDRRELRHDQRELRKDRRELRQDRRQGADRQERRHDRREIRGDRREMRQDRRELHRDRFYYNARGPEWRRGHHVPPEYRHRQYVVSNWRAHHLAPPPRGYQWIQVGSDYVLAAIATGIIANLILNSR